jgi:hypothetical protein
MMAQTAPFRSTRAAIIERFEQRERSRARPRFFELATMAALYAKERDASIEDAYAKLVKALDETGFSGTRILYRHPDISPPYFSKVRLRRPRDLKKVEYRPHKTSPLITRAFIEERIKNLDLAATIEAYLSRCWIPASHAARWLQSQGILVPASIASSAPVNTPSKPSRSEPPQKWRPHKRSPAAGAIKKMRPYVLSQRWIPASNTLRLNPDKRNERNALGRPKKSPLKLQRAKWAIEKLGPLAFDLTPKELHREVSEILKKETLPLMSQKTVVTARKELKQEK